MNQRPLLGLFTNLAVIGAVGVLVSLAACFGVWALETQRIRVEFTASARVVAYELEETLGILQHNVEVINALYASSSRVTADEFHSMTRPHLSDPRAARIIKAIAWIPYPIAPTQPQRPASQIHTAYIEPEDSGWIAIERAINADPAILMAFARARDRGQIAMFAPITVDGQPGMLLLRPTYRRGFSSDTVEERRANIMGFVVGAYRLPAVIERALIVPEARSLDVYLFDQSRLASPQLLLMHAALSRAAPLAPSDAHALASLADASSHTTAIRVAGHPWLITAAPAPDYASSRRTWLPWGALLGGLIITALAVFYMAQRQGASQALLRSEAKFRRYIEHAPLAVFVADRRGRFVETNRAAEQLLGYDAGSLAGLGVADIIPDDDREVSLRSFAEVVSNGYTEGEFRLKQSDGAPIWVSLRAIRLGDDRFIAFCVDISERKQAEAREQRRHAMLEQVIHLGKAITQLADPQQCLRQIHHSIQQGLAFDRVGLFLYDGEAAQVRGALGTTHDGALEDISDYVESVHNAPWEEVFHEPNGLRMTDDYTALHRLSPDSKMYGVRQHVALVAWVGKRPVALIAVDNLISGRPFSPEQLEALQLFAGYAGLAIENARWNARLEQHVAERTADLSRANLELTRAARTKDEFLATMSHELRTPLNSILGLAETLAEQIRGPLNSHQIRSVQGIEASGRHLLALINDILDMAKIGAGKLELQIETLSIEALCRSSLVLVSEMAARKRLRVAFTCGDLAAQVAADPRRLKQILVNLLSNAVKFTAEGGEIGLDVQPDAEHEVMRFSVSDTGIGIASGDAGRLFEPFTQLDSGLARQHEGTGLGLALVQRLTELHGGSVSVTSAGVPGKGSTFTVTIPWHADRPTPMAGAPPATAPASPPLRLPEARVPATLLPQPVILLAEDNETNIQAIEDYVEYLGYRLVIARNGQEAIDRACEAQPDLILMDIQMPVLDGLEAIRRLRGMPPFVATPIVALTALAMPGDRERCLEAGASEYVSKPVNLRGLATIIGQLLQGRQQ